MSSPFPTTNLLPRLQVGQPVHVNTRSGWLHATVTAVAHHRVEVTYQAAIAVRYSAAVAAHLVRPAGRATRPAATNLVTDNQPTGMNDSPTAGSPRHSRHGHAITNDETLRTPPTHHAPGAGQPPRRVPDPQLSQAAHPAALTIHTAL